MPKTRTNVILFIRNFCKSRKDPFQRELTTGASNLPDKGKSLIVIIINSREGIVGGRGRGSVMF